MADDTIYHIASRDDWEAALQEGAYSPPSLAVQGFVHCSTRGQVVETANRFFHGQDGLVLLCIDVVRLDAPLRYEPPDMSGHVAIAGQSLFPHLYGPLSLQAVVDVLPFPARVDGTFALPPSLAAAGTASSPLQQATHVTEETAQRLLQFVERSDPVRRLRASQLVSAVIGAVGLALFIVGIERAAADIPVISNAWGSIGVGLALMVVTGLLLRKLAGGQ